MNKKNAGHVKILTLLFLFAALILTAYHIVEVITIPANRVLSDKTMLVIATALLGYLWVQDMIDKYALRDSCSKLVNIQKKLKETNLETVRSLALAEEAKNPYARGHSKRVTDIAMLIAKKLGFTKEELARLENASILHDIGKMGIGDVILQKAGSLTLEEWKIIKKHPNLALDILAPLEFLSKEKDIIKHHHERYDGKGYPNGIKGKKIDMGARILTVADAFDAMRSMRPYRNPLSMEKAISELKRGAGKQFDPLVVEVLLEILKERKGVL